MELLATVIRLPQTFCLAVCIQRKRSCNSGAKHILQETICSDPSLFKLSCSFCLFSPCQGHIGFLYLLAVSYSVSDALT